MVCEKQARDRGGGAMIIDVNEATLASIQNPALRSYAQEYVRNYQDFMQQIRRMGMEIEEKTTVSRSTNGSLHWAGRVRSSAIDHCQIRVTAYVRPSILDSAQKMSG